MTFLHSFVFSIQGFDQESLGLVLFFGDLFVLRTRTLHKGGVMIRWLGRLGRCVGTSYHPIFCFPLAVCFGGVLGHFILILQLHLHLHDYIEVVMSCNCSCSSPVRLSCTHQSCGEPRPTSLAQHTSLSTNSNTKIFLRYHCMTHLSQVSSQHHFSMIRRKFGRKLMMPLTCLMGQFLCTQHLPTSRCCKRGSPNLRSCPHSIRAHHGGVTLLLNHQQPEQNIMPIVSSNTAL